MYIAAGSHPALARIGRRQLGVSTIEQLRMIGVPWGFARDQLSAHRWTRLGEHVVLMQNAAPTRSQLIWAAVLDGGERCATASHTALELAGFVGFAAETKDVHVVIEHGARYVELPGVVVHESRRLHPETFVVRDGVRCTPIARSAIDAAAWQPWPRFACTMLAAVVQQGLCSAADLDAQMRVTGRVRHKAYMRLAIADIAGGAESIGEIDVARFCRRFGLPRPDRQVLRTDSSGRRRYLDCEWVLADGTHVVLEVDGRHHLDVQQWQDDMRRERRIVTSRRWVLRATSIEVRLEPDEVAADLVALGVPATRLVRRSRSQGFVSA